MGLMQKIEEKSRIPKEIGTIESLDILTLLSETVV